MCMHFTENPCAFYFSQVIPICLVPFAVNFLLDIGGEPDLSDFADIVEPKRSSFSELFMEQEKMRVSSMLYMIGTQ